MLSSIILMGRLTRDIELRYTQAGTPVASFTLAVERDFAPQDGGERETDFIDIVAWRHTAEFVSRYFVKGQLIAVRGRLQIRDWTDREGGKRRSAEVVAESVYFTGDKRGRSEAGASSSGGASAGASATGNSTWKPATGPVSVSYDEPEWSEYDPDDGDLPF